MAEVTFPAGAEITAMHIEPWYPGQIALQSPFTGSVQVLSRGYGSWRGTVEFAGKGNFGRELAQAMEAFFASLMGQGNWCALPLFRPSFAAAATAKVKAVVNENDGTIRHELKTALPAKAGHWLAAGDRRYTVRAINAAQTEITLDPQIPLAVDTVLQLATDIRARAQSARMQPTRRISDFWGPWRWDWQENVNP